MIPLAAPAIAEPTLPIVPIFPGNNPTTLSIGFTTRPIAGNALFLIHRPAFLKPLPIFLKKFLIPIDVCLMSEKRARPLMTKHINDYIDTLHFRSTHHVLNRVRERFPDEDDDTLKDIINRRLKDRFIKESNLEPYYFKIFSTRPGCWFHDLLDNGKNNDPRYWHIFIGTNNHYGVAQPLKNKTASDIKRSLIQFVNQYHPTKLTSDEESAFIEKSVIQYLTNQHVDMHIITEQNHSALGIIDRFIRTLRDMNIPTEKGTRQSHHEKYKSFTPKRMAKLIEIYNDTPNARIKCTPKEMYDDPDKEKEYIFDQLKKRDKQQGIKDLVIKEGSYVRYILPRSNGMVKKRFQYSWECYKVESVKGNMYTLMARDGTVMNLPRFKLILCSKDGSKPNNIKWADTIPGKWTGVISKILSFDPRKNKYTVLFTVPGGEDYVDVVPVRNLRDSYPQRMSELEREFNEQQQQRT